MKTTYPDDAQFISTLDVSTQERFSAFIDGLEKLIDAMPEKPYETPLHEGTGLECWFRFFELDFSPAAALDEDLSNAYD